MKIPNSIYEDVHRVPATVPLHHPPPCIPSLPHTYTPAHIYTQSFYLLQYQALGNVPT